MKDDEQVARAVDALLLDDVDETVLADHVVEMVGHSADQAFAALVRKTSRP